MWGEWIATIKSPPPSSIVWKHSAQDVANGDPSNCPNCPLLLAPSATDSQPRAPRKALALPNPSSCPGWRSATPSNRFRFWKVDRRVLSLDAAHGLSLHPSLSPWEAKGTARQVRASQTSLNLRVPTSRTRAFRQSQPCRTASRVLPDHTMSCSSAVVPGIFPCADDPTKYPQAMSKFFTEHTNIPR